MLVPGKLEWRGFLFKMGGKSSTEKSVERGPRQSKIGQRLVKAMAEKAAGGEGTKLKTFNSIILKFPKIDESLEQVRVVFRKYDRNGNGIIDLEELKACFTELQVEFTDEEVRAYHAESDMDSNHGIDFKEFIVVLALVYLLGKAGSEKSSSPIGLPQLEATFDTIVEAFVFFDRDGDGYVSKKEMVYAMNEASPGATRSCDKIGVKRFEEMDWDKDGTITFKEFLFAFTSWVGLERDNDEEAEDGAEFVASDPREI